SESFFRPDCLPAAVVRETLTRLGCPARARLPVIIATITWGNPVPRLSACTTKAGRPLAVRKLESGKSTMTTSPRLHFIVDVHFRVLPIFGKRPQAPPQVGSLHFV